MLRKLLLLFIIMQLNIYVFAQHKQKLIWNDEFNYTGLPDSDKWSYEHGHIRNLEQQYYTYARKENAFVHDGYMEITARKETYVNEFYKHGSEGWTTADSLAHYTSASVVSLGKASWKYGRIEVRAKLAKGLGTWPAIWMMGANQPKLGWPLCGEIDIMEFVGIDSTHLYGTIHYAQEDGKAYTTSGGNIETLQPYNDFHIYALEWNKKEMKIFFDDKIIRTFAVGKARVKSGNPFRRPFYLILNLALGGSWAKEVNDGNLPQSYLIDYVRVYR